MMDIDSGNAYNTNNDENLAKRPRLAIAEPSTQFYDKSDFNFTDPKSLLNEFREEIKFNMETLHGRIREFFVNDKFTDVNIICENQIFGCHRLILAATCEYFEIMFSENFRENYAKEITLHDISKATFKEILTFVYKGYIEINVDNVFELLCASNLFGLTFVESKCTRYLLEERIPVEQALQLFIFACNLQKTALIPAVSQLILEHLDHLSKSAVYLEILFDNLCLLLTNFCSFSLNDDQVILKALSRWVFHSGRNPEDKKKLFDGLVKKVQRWYQYSSVEDACYSFEDGEPIDDVTGIDENHASSIHQSVIHVYVSIPSLGVETRKEYNRTNIFSLKFEKDNNSIDWYHSFSMDTNVSEMRTVVIDNQLYCLRKDEFCDMPTFSVSSSANLSLQKLALKIPEYYSPNTLLCCDKKTSKIYSLSSISPRYKSQPYLSLYNRELDEWTPNLMRKGNQMGNCMTCHDDGRLYLIYGVTGNRFVEAYDHRDGKWSALTQYNGSCGTVDECCSFKGKIYVSCYSAQKQNAMEIFDPRAKKWLNGIEWNIEGYQESKKETLHRLLPYNNHLWMFNNAKTRSNFRGARIKGAVVKTYNLFQQKFTLSPSLDEAIWQTLRSSHKDLWYIFDFPNQFYAKIMDVVAFDPL